MHLGPSRLFCPAAAYSKSGAAGECNKNCIRTAKLFRDNDDWGLIRHFGTREVRALTTRDWQLFIDRLTRKHSDLSSSTRNMLMATFRTVLKVARDDGLIDVAPSTPMVRQKDNPRAFVRFAPLVPDSKDEYKKLLDEAKQMAKESVVVRGIEVTEELYDLILFCVHSFVRPTTSELYAPKHDDIALETKPRRLLVTVRSGKTGFGIVNTMTGAVTAYQRMRRLSGKRKYSHTACWITAAGKRCRRQEELPIGRG
jgi:integrase